MTRDQEAILALTADNERLRDSLEQRHKEVSAAYGMAIRKQEEIERLRGLLREAKQATRRLIEPGPNSFWWELSGRIDAALGEPATEPAKITVQPTVVDPDQVVRDLLSAGRCAVCGEPFHGISRCPRFVTPNPTDAAP